MSRTVKESDVRELLAIQPLSRRELARELGVEWQDATLGAVIASLDRAREVDLMEGYPERWTLLKRPRVR